jgi:hypothetical protein
MHVRAWLVYDMAHWQLSPVKRALEGPAGGTARGDQISSPLRGGIPFVTKNRLPGLPCSRVRVCERECACGCGGVCCMLSFQWARGIGMRRRPFLKLLVGAPPPGVEKKPKPPMALRKGRRPEGVICLEAV